MSLDYLEDLKGQVDNGKNWYAAPGGNTNEWKISEDPESLKGFAQRAANQWKFEQSVYQLVNQSEVGTGGSYLVCKKILEPGPRGEPRLQWMLVDTKEAAEMLRDVSQGPSPYFGTFVIETFQPVGG